MRINLPAIYLAAPVAFYVVISVVPPEPARAGDVQSAVARSPDGRNAISLATEGDDANRRLIWTVTRDGKPVLGPASLDVTLVEHGSMPDGAKFGQIEQGKRDEPVDLLWGKSSAVRDRCSWTSVPLTSTGGIQWQIALRAYDDGVAFRYMLPKQEGLADFAIKSESTELRFAGAPTIHFTACEKFTTDHERPYQRKPLAELPREILLDLPLLAVWPDGSAAAVTEARIRDFCGMYLQRANDDTSGVSTGGGEGAGRVVLRTRLSPLPRRNEACVVGHTPHASPWRVVLLGESAGRLLESNLLVCLNDERPAGDYRWIQPGKTTWHWWNGTSETGLPFATGMNFATHKYYIDFCARHGIAYHAVVADDRPWYVQTKAQFAPTADTDILTPRPELEFPKILAYAKEKGVGIRLWVHWKPLVARLEEAFSQYEAWGVRGLMVDFLDRDDQEIVNVCQRILESAARHKLHIQFHGSYKPSGEQRTFPNLFNREGVLNLEYLKWSDRPAPPHNVGMAYTRLLAGPMDYHLGGFRSISRAKFKPRNENPFVLGTRCHHLAMYVVYENPMPMVCDTPSTYEGPTGRGAAGFDFLAEVPTTWDETRFVQGEAGEYIVMARRKGNAWYLGGMTDWTIRKLEVPLGFLGPGDYQARLYVDGSMDEDQPNAIEEKQRGVRAGEKLPVALAPGGGFVAAIRPK
jgi:alpha-glucosidase